jgi:cell division protein FtsI/penicillin-binding protein 2
MGICISLSTARLEAHEDAREQGISLFGQTAASVLDSHFKRDELSWLLLDSKGNVLAEHWPNAQVPISPGSLVKPFLAAAYGEQHAFAFPHVECTGANGRCWLRRGHGRLGMEQAIAQSCNVYFLSLAQGIDRVQAAATFKRYGLAGPPSVADDASLIGLGEAWRETPLALAQGYLALLEPSHSSEASVSPRLLKGMSTAAQSGTAREVDAVLGERAALAKTGTASCSHHPRASADGFAIVLYPAAQPRLLLLVRQHGATGARTAATAGAMLQALGAGARP